MPENKASSTIYFVIELRKSDVQIRSTRIKAEKEDVVREPAPKPKERHAHERDATWNSCSHCGIVYTALFITLAPPLYDHKVNDISLFSALLGGGAGTVCGR